MNKRLYQSLTPNPPPKTTGGKEEPSLTRRRFYAPPPAFAADERSATLDADETRHARGVLRLKSGDEIFVFDGAGREFQCTVRTLSRDMADLDVICEVAPAQPESTLHLTLAIALLKGEKFDLVVQKSTELGVTRIVPVDSERAEIRLRDHRDIQKRVTRWERIAREAAKQSGRATVPEIATPLLFDSFISEPGAPRDLASPNLGKLMFSERGGSSFGDASSKLLGRSEQILALVGPEGGWTDQEIERAREAVWEVVTLRGRTLRAETAAIIIAGLLQHRFGDLG
jgi:16S rRNA (uracil1498-N3)-methyltransferase